MLIKSGQLYYGGADHPGDIPQLCLDLVQHVGEVELFVVNLHVGDVPPLVVAHPIGVNWQKKDKAARSADWPRRPVFFSWRTDGHGTSMEKDKVIAAVQKKVIGGTLFVFCGTP